MSRRSQGVGRKLLPGSGRAATVPTHVAIIMDGNGRWAARARPAARRRSPPRRRGHSSCRPGGHRARRPISDGLQLLVRELAPAGPGGRRPDGPAEALHPHDLADLHAQNVRVRIIGEREGLSPDIRSILAEAEDLTRGNTGLTLVVAFNYGGRQEIVRAVRTLAERVRAGSLAPEDIDPDAVRDRPRHLRHSGSRSRHPHVGRAARFEFPDLADGLFGIRVPAGFLAGLRSRDLPGGHRRVLPARPAVRRAERPGRLA